VFLGVTAGAPLLAPGFALRPELALMARNGVQSLRVPFYWRAAQPYRSSADVPAAERRRFVAVGGVPTDFGATDPAVEAAARAGVSVLPVVLGSPPWAARHPALSNSAPAGTASYAAFARALRGVEGDHAPAAPRDHPVAGARGARVDAEDDHASGILRGAADASPPRRARRGSRGERDGRSGRSPPPPARDLRLRAAPPSSGRR